MYTDTESAGFSEIWKYKFWNENDPATSVFIFCQKILR